MRKRHSIWDENLRWNFQHRKPWAKNQPLKGYYTGLDYDPNRLWWDPRKEAKTALFWVGAFAFLLFLFYVGATQA